MLGIKAKRIGITIIVAAALLATACNKTDADESVNSPGAVQAEVAQAEPTLTPTAKSTPVPTADPMAWKRETKGKGFEYDMEKLTYDLVWSDEFDVDGKPDPSKWTFETGGSGWGNHELEYYTAGDNAEVKDSKLTITLRKEDKGGQDVTSSRMVTKGKGDWLYGKVEVRAKLPVGLGTWPAIWMLPTDGKYGGWPASGEIDIMEHVGYDLDTIVTTVHTSAYNHRKGTQKGKSEYYEGITQDFHVYGIEWLPDKIRFFVDGNEQFVYDPKTLITEPTYLHWPYDKPFYLILNIAFGGDWGGAKGVDYDCLPATMEVDYVRVYQSREINALTGQITEPVKPIAEHKEGEGVAFYLTKNEENAFVQQADLQLAIEKQEGLFSEIVIDPAKTFQEIDGFGASFTDSSAYLINQKLSAADKDSLMEALFDPEKGIGLSFTRQPMGSSDFARDYYSFDDMPSGETDFDLANFSIEYDKADIIPLLKQAKDINPDLLMMSSPWSPPGWMKTGGSMQGGSLRKDCYEVYANYFLKYIQEYKKEGLDIYAITPQNEPLYVPSNYAGCGWTAGEEAQFISENLGPVLRENGVTAKILSYDHNWDAYNFPETIEGLGAAKYVDGIAWHWYGGDPSAQTDLYERFGKDAYFTEGSGGSWIAKGEWNPSFMNFMVMGINIMNHYSRSLVFWNFALDEHNGPVVPGFSKDGSSTCSGIVKVDQGTGELTYNCDYYALAHFSKFIRPGAVRVHSESKGKVYTLVARNTDGSLVIVVANDEGGLKPVRVNIGGKSFSMEMPGKSAATFVLDKELL